MSAWKWQTEFPWWSDGDMPEEVLDAIVKNELQDTSWHNDAAPTFQIAGHDPDCTDPTLWVHHHNPRLRDFPTRGRFVVCVGDVDDQYQEWEFDLASEAIAKLKELDKLQKPK